MRILLASDGSRSSTNAAKYLVKHLLREKPDVLVLNADAPLSRSVAIELGSDEVARYHAENSVAALKPVLSLLQRARVKHREKSLVGDPASTILEVAVKEKCDLIVMGSHGRNALKSLFLGSVALKVIADGRVPVLVVR